MGMVATRTLRLDAAGQKMVEANIGLIGWFMGLGRCAMYKERLGSDEVFAVLSLGLCKACASYEPASGALSSYCYRIFANDLSNRLRAEDRQVAANFGSGDCTIPGRESGGLDEDESRQLRERVKRLAPAQMAAVEAVLDGKELVEHSAERGRCRSCAGANYQGGVKRLREMYRQSA